ncbi:MAG: biopolymer transporter ExbD [Spirochaetaceae bacterium]|nr:biopolymer transporter ExbD [Spirochaetaceae bacterium]
MKSFTRKAAQSVGVDITPLLDVVFQLLLFFILTSALVQPSIELDLPESGEESEAIEAELVISADSEGRVFFNDQSIAREEIEDALRSFAEQKSGGEVILRVDSAASYGDFFFILDASRNAGMKNLHLAYEEE